MAETVDDLAIYKIRTEEITRYWEYIRDFLEPALATFDQCDLIPLDVVLARLVDGQMQGWLITKESNPVAALVTQIRSYPKGDAVHMFLMGGSDFMTWAPFAHLAINAYAKEIGAKWLEADTREGVGKLLFKDQLKYKRKHVNYIYEV